MNDGKASLNKEIRREIREHLRRLQRRQGSSRRSTEKRYRFLRRVYRNCENWASEPKRKAAARTLGIAPSASLSDFVAAVMEIVDAKTPRQTRSKHARTLRYAAERGVAGNKLIAFIKDRGGFNKCAARRARRQRKQATGH